MLDAKIPDKLTHLFIQSQNHAEIAVKYIIQEVFIVAAVVAAQAVSQVNLHHHHPPVGWVEVVELAEEGVALKPKARPVAALLAIKKRKN